jgi:hypothetical protein
MKNSTKTAIAAVLLIVLGATASAQNTSSTTAQVTSTLLTQLSVSKNSDVAFGQIATGTTPTLAGNSATKTAVGSDAGLGKFTITGTSGATVKVTYDATVTLLNGGNAADGQLTFHPSVYRTAATSASYGQTALASDGTYTINSSNSSAAAGTDFIFVGGSVTEYNSNNAIPALSSSLKTGNYSGTFNITAIYN